jgi:hypothetical protein
MKTQLKLITLFMVTSVISLLGCGGGEEEVTTKEVVETSVSTDSSPDVASNTVDLISEPEFDLSSANELRIGLPATTSTSTRYFINICTDFSTDDENNLININYASCKLRTELSITKQEFTLSLSASELRLIAQIWPIEENAQPITTYWNIAEYGKQWPIAF